MEKISSVIREIFSNRKDVTLLGVGPMSPLIVDASIELAAELDFPLFFIASRNQIESESLGGGYVNYWDQSRFSEYVDEAIARLGFEGLLFKCRDHGGPWQKDSEFKEGIDESEAIKRACDSYRKDLESDFRFLHVDTSKDPDYEKVVPAELAVERLVETVKRIEKIRTELGVSDVLYEASLEETNGLTSEVEEFDHFVSVLVEKFKENGLPLPAFMVGNTGTLTKMDENIGGFNRDITRELAEIAGNHNMIFKAHNCDYLDSEVLSIHPGMQVGMANVAPEFGKVETEALLGLCSLEEQYAKLLPSDDIPCSGLRGTLWKKIEETGKWKKWVTDEQKNLKAKDLFSDESFVERTINVNGHYFFADKEVQEAREKLYININTITGGGVDAIEFIKGKVKESIGRYVQNFNIEGLTSEVKASLDQEKIEEATV